jgi:hypothetical protein
MNPLNLTVRDMSSLDTLRPVTGGVPIAEGAAPAGSGFTLHDADGAEVPLQTEVLARWDDGSARWVLLDFQAAPPADGEASYTLRSDALATAAPEATCSVAEDARTITCGQRTIGVADDGTFVLGDCVDATLIVTDAAGNACAMKLIGVEMLAEGPMRATIEARGEITRPPGERWFSFRLRVSAYAGLDCIRFEPLIVMDSDEGLVQEIGGVALQFRPRAEISRWRIGGDPGAEGGAGETASLRQTTDLGYRLTAGSDLHRGERAPGWGEADLPDSTLALAMRDFWRIWPTGIAVAEDGIAVEMLPAAPQPDDFAAMEPWWKYGYFFGDGHYRIRTGQARRWEVWLDLSGDGETLARSIDQPLIPIADPAQAIATGVWDEIMPAGGEMAEYDAWAEKLFGALQDSVEQQRDYGAMNWGDWYGERHVNWGNHEYDTANQLLIQFARTGDPRYFYAADAAARHSIEVDTVHHMNDALWDHYCETSGGPKRGEEGEEPDYPYRAGMVHQHTVGHVSCLVDVEAIREIFIAHNVGNSPNPYLCLQPTNLGHIFTQGSARHYFLTGDRFIRETVELIGDNLARLVEDRRFPFMGTSHCGRVAGWTMLALAGAYDLSGDDRYLAAMRTIAEDAMRDQDPNCGGWLYYPMAHGHCNCVTVKHTGMAGFITAVLINGLSRYYQLSGDERLPECIDRAVTFLDLDTWHEQWRGWRYTSCPATALQGVSQPGVTMMAHVNGARFGSNPEHLRVLRVAWEEKFGKLLRVNVSRGFGKTWTSTMYGCAETAGILARRQEE